MNKSLYITAGRMIDKAKNIVGLKAACCIGFLNVFLLLSINANIFSQSDSLVVNGFAKYIAGEQEDEDCSCTPNAVTAMTVRCLNDKDYIEWETDQVPNDYKGKTVTFIWSAGYSTGTKEEERKFYLYANDKLTLSFQTASRVEGGDWTIKNGLIELSFKNKKFYNRSGNTTKDYWGFFTLTVPVSELSSNRALKIKVKGDATGSRHWYRAMEYKLLTQIAFADEKIIYKNENGELSQRVKVSVEDYCNHHLVEVYDGKGKKISAEINLGMNEFYIPIEVVESPTQKTFEAKIGFSSKKYDVEIKPVKNITFYLLPHSHVDIGYTDLQPVIEKKQWKNIERAIKLSERSAANTPGSVFKWNVEVLWAVKSYLEKFPEKRAEFFSAVRKGWIGLDGLYCNMLTGLCRPEELYRLVEYSNRLEKEIEVQIESAMISDVPGYTWGLVQTFADNGIKYFSVGTNETDRIGNSLKQWGDKPFYWESPSGKNKVLVWLAGKGYSLFHHYSIPRDGVSQLVKYLDELDAKNYPYDIVQLRYTIGDNSVPDSTLAGFVKQWNETHTTPQFKIATTAELFKDFEKKYGAQIPTYKGDFTPYWEDGAGSSSKETALNRKTAEKLNQLEVLYSLNGDKDFPFNEFDEAWKNVLLYSEHTWGAWNSISDPENEMVKKEWAIKKSFAVKADSITQKLSDDITNEKISSSETVEYVTVWNTNSWTRSDVITIPSSVKLAGDYLVDDNGKHIETQKLLNGELVFIAKEIPSLSSRQFRFTKRNPGAIEYKDQSGNVLSESITSLIDVDSQYGFNGFIYTGKNASEPQIFQATTSKLKEKGPVVNSIVYESTVPGCNSLTREIRAYAGLNKTEIINTIDKKKIYEKENLRFAFPFNIENPVTRIDISWAVIKPEVDQLLAANKNYFTAQRWVDISNDKVGVTLATIDAPFVEVGGMNAEAWMVSPRDKWFEHTSSSNKIFSWVMNNSWNTNYKAEQEGVVTFKYALQSHKQFDYLNAYRFGVEQAQPLVVVFGKKKSQRNNLLPTVDEKSSVIISSLKLSRYDKGYIIRLYNPTDKASQTVINLNGVKVKLWLSNGNEENIELISKKLSFEPFEVKTIKAVLE
jgi:alpha-mannosidase